MQYNKALRSPRSRAFSWSWVSLVKSILQSVHPERRARAGDAGPERKSKDPENDSIAIQLQGVLGRNEQRAIQPSPSAQLLKNKLFPSKLLRKLAAEKNPARF